MAGQCWALIVLKFRLMRTMWTGAHTASMLFTVLTGVVFLFIAIGAGVGLFFLGWVGMPRRDPIIGLGILDALVVFYLFFWAAGLMMELQRSEIIDQRKLLYLPIPPRLIFLMNFAASLVGPGLVFFVPAALGLISGLTLRFGPQVALWGAPLALSFFLMLSAWAFYLRGWLALMMENKRRRRVILTVLPLAFVVLGQLPGLLSVSMRPKADGSPPALSLGASPERIRAGAVLANQVIPPAWFAYGMWSAAHGQPRGAAASTAGCLLMTIFGLGLGFRATMRFHTAAGSVRARKRAKRPVRLPLTARHWIGLDTDTAALASASYLSYLRHPNIRMLVLMPLCMGVLFIFMYRSGVYGQMSQNLPLQSDWAPIVVLIWPFFNFSYVLFNIFGIDRESFRGLILLPVPRHKVLYAKHLGLFPFVGGMSLAFVGFGALMLGISAQTTAISAMQVVQLFLLYAMLGSFTSIYFPHHIGWNGMRNSNTRVLTICIGMLSAAMLGVLMLPTTVCLFLDDFARLRWGYEGVSLGILASSVFLAATILGYRMVMRHAGDLLYAREIRMLDQLLRNRE